MIVAAAIACNSSATPTATPPSPLPPATATAQPVIVLTANVVTSTPPTPPTVVIQTPTATSTTILNGGTATPPPASIQGAGCDNVYQPVRDGATWTYSGSVVGKDFNKTWTQVDTITDVGATDFVRAVKLPDKSILDAWKCTGDGLVAWSPDSGLLAALLEGPSGAVTVKTTAATGVTLPVSLQVGDAWEQRTVLDISDLKSTTTSGELDLNFRAADLEQVTVPAGSFNALRVSVHAELLIQAGKGLLTTFDGSQWMVTGLGLVKRSGSLTLVQGQAPGQLDFDLVAYHIP